MNDLIPIIIIGARIDGQAGVVLDLIERTKKYKVIGFLDSTPKFQNTLIKNIPVIGSSDNLEKQSFETKYFHIAIGDNVARGRLFNELKNLRYEVVSLIHPTSVISKNAKIGKGCFLGPNAILNNGTVIDDAVIINSGAIIEHDNYIGFSSNMAPGSKTGGRVIVGKYAFIGIGATILPDIRIGEGAMVGAGSTLVKNVDDKTTVSGYAAKKHKQNIYVTIAANNEK